jgi:hypothetical protein
VALHYLPHVFELYSRIPDVVGEDEDDRTLLVVAGTGVTKHGRRRYAVPFHLVFEGVK